MVLQEQELEKGVLEEDYMKHGEQQRLQQEVIVCMGLRRDMQCIEGQHLPRPTDSVGSQIRTARSEVFLKRL